MSSSDLPSDWSSLPPELLSSIFPLLPTNSDCIAFRAVCSSWRSASPRRLPFPLLFYPLSTRSSNNFVSFYDLVASNTGSVDLLGPNSDADPHWQQPILSLCGATQGFIIISYYDYCLLVVNPVTRYMFDLPNLDTKPEKIILTSLPPAPFAAVALMGSNRPLLFWTDGQDSWSALRGSSLLP